jgi:hypothetical protein
LAEKKFQMCAALCLQLVDRLCMWMKNLAFQPLCYHVRLPVLRAKALFHLVAAAKSARRSGFAGRCDFHR